MLVKDEVVAIAAMRELIDNDIEDLSLLQDQLSNERDDPDLENIACASFYLDFASTVLGRIIRRYDEETTEEIGETIEAIYEDLIDAEVKEPSKSLVPINLKLFTKEKPVDKPLTEMTPQEIGEGTIIFNPEGEAWVVKLWGNSTTIDLKNGAVTKVNVKPEKLIGWSFDPIDFDETIAHMIEEYGNENSRDGFRGWITAEIIKRQKEASHPLGTIKSVNSVLDKMKARSVSD